MTFKNIVKQCPKFVVANIPIYGYAVLLWTLLEAVMHTDSFASQLEQSLSIWLLIIFSSCVFMLYIKSFEDWYDKCCAMFKRVFIRPTNQPIEESSKKYQQTLKGRIAKLEGLTQKKAFVRQAIAPLIRADIARRTQAGDKLTKLSSSKIAEFIRDNYKEMPAELQACFAKVVSPKIQQQENVYTKEVYAEYKSIVEDIKLSRKQI